MKNFKDFIEEREVNTKNFLDLPKLLDKEKELRGSGNFNYEKNFINILKMANRPDEIKITMKRWNISPQKANEYIFSTNDPEIILRGGKFLKTFNYKKGYGYLLNSKDPKLMLRAVREWKNMGKKTRTAFLDKISRIENLKTEEVLMFFEEFSKESDKEKYKKLTKKVHPDIGDDENLSKEEKEELSKQLNAARDSGDTRTLNKIHDKVLKPKKTTKKKKKSNSGSSDVLDNRSDAIARFFGTEKKGYKGLATRLSRDLKKDISPKEVKHFLKMLGGTKYMKRIFAMSKNGNIRDPRAFRFSLIYRAMLDYFKNKQDFKRRLTK